MRYRAVRRVVLFAMLAGLAVYLGCAAPKPCTVTPVDIEEIKSDMRDLSTTLAERKGVLAKIEEELAALRVEIAEKQAQVPVMQAELEQLEKASGRTKVVEPETPETASGPGSE